MSNLPFLSKITEKVVGARLRQHMQEHSLYEPMQSAYRPGHSTETALVRVTNDLLRAVDQHQVVILVLLDLSAAFDTIDHGILLSRLQNRFGVCGQSLQWFRSYLADRVQVIHIKNTSSTQAHLEFGVPQGSVLGPVLYICYTVPLGDIARRHQLQLHLCADDTQLYLTFTPINGEAAELAVQRVQNCVAEMRSWLSQNKQQLSDPKTEALVICTPHGRQRVDIPHIEIGGSLITPASVVRNIGTHLDETLSMVTQVNNLCSRCYFYIRNISRVRHLMDRRTAMTMVHAYVTSRLDGGNAVLYGLPETLISKLQRVQNAAARVITQTDRREHITPVLKVLHWLPVKQRIVFKVLVLTFKAVHGLAPGYLSELVTPYHPARSLRSSDSALLQTPRSRLRTYGDRAFAIAAPRLWNMLPLNLRQLDSESAFRKKLKTHLFKESFE